MSYIGTLRRQIGHQKIIAPGVRAVIRDLAGRVFLQRRGDFGTWGLPAGGLELDENVSAARAREVREETGLTVHRAIPFGVYSDPSYSVIYPIEPPTRTAIRPSPSPSPSSWRSGAARRPATVTRRWNATSSRSMRSRPKRRSASPTARHSAMPAPSRHTAS